jgi:cyanophycinase
VSRRKGGNRERHGRLFIIGGGEDRKDDKIVLSRLVELAGGSDARIAVVTAASTLHHEMWSVYDEAFGALGVRQRAPVVIENRDDANDETRAEALFNADAVFMTGGDQKRLLQLIGGTKIDKAMHRALRERGACIAGTSAGASAMSEHMLWEGGTRDPHPEKGTVHLAAGLGFVRRVVIDQHFSERQRLGRLLSIVAQNPYLLGCGIDEDTALVVEPGVGLEVVGEGAVTLLDGREMLSNYLEIDERERLELTNVKLHLLPAGARYYFDQQSDDGQDRRIPAALRDVVAAVSSAPEPVPAA